MSDATLSPTLKERASPVPVRMRSSSQVFSINFIRHEIMPLGVRRALTLVYLGYVLTTIIVMLGLLGGAFQTRWQWHQVQMTIQGAMPSSAQMGVLKQDMVTLRQRAMGDLGKLNTAIAFQRQQFPVSAKLEAITETLPPRTWVTRLAGKRDDRTLAIHAVYLVDPQTPDALPVKAWTAALRVDPRFGQGLKRLDLESSSRDTQGKAELFSFELVAEWQPASSAR